MALVLLPIVETQPPGILHKKRAYPPPQETKSAQASPTLNTKLDNSSYTEIRLIVTVQVVCEPFIPKTRAS
ncbi:hypothetical protein B9Z55_027693 [Caenorhabditis nigoni]|uniref:Uncharacterized protein n=1 Tax=Caenorhabditis nigoni TaxID=1611254 RepID=A0A2G5SFD0_9PELO|nr:hypothetical protein B9Z55_027693 [Caenorhabditis nigoni]